MIDHIGIEVSNYKAAVDFYQKALDPSRQYANAESAYCFFSARSKNRRHFL